MQILLSQVSKDMNEPLVPMLFPLLSPPMGDAEFQHNGQLGRRCEAKWTRKSIQNRKSQGKTLANGGKAEAKELAEM